VVKLNDFNPLAGKNLFLFFSVIYIDKDHNVVYYLDMEEKNQTKGDLK